MSPAGSSPLGPTDQSAQDPDDKTGQDQDHDHPDQQPRVASLLGQARRRVRISTTGDVRRGQTAFASVLVPLGVIGFGVRGKGWRSHPSILHHPGDSMLPPVKSPELLTGCFRSLR